MPREKIVRGRDLRLVSASVPTTRENSCERDIGHIQNTIADIKNTFQTLRDTGYSVENEEENDKPLDMKTGKSKKTIGRYNTRQLANRQAAKKRIDQRAEKEISTKKSS